MMPACAPATTRSKRQRAGIPHEHAAAIQRGADHLHRCGPRAVAEFLAELVVHIDALPEMLAALAEWRRLDPATVRGVVNAWCGGQEFAPALSPMEGKHAPAIAHAAGAGLTP